MTTTTTEPTATEKLLAFMARHSLPVRGAAGDGYVTDPGVSPVLLEQAGLVAKPWRHDLVVLEPRPATAEPRRRVGLVRGGAR